MTSERNAAADVILHIGAGSFHRAHQAWYLHRLIDSGDTRWSLTVGNIRGDMNAVLEALAAQDGAYTLETVTPQGERAYETVKSITKVVPWSADLERAGRGGAAPECKIVSFTVTEGGYYLDEHHKLDTANPDLAADLKGAPHDDLRRARRDSRRAHEAGRRQGHAAELRQPAQQRRSLQGRHARIPATARRDRTARLDDRQHVVPEFDGRPHHAASHARRARTRARPRPASTTARPSWARRSSSG